MTLISTLVFIKNKPLLEALSKELLYTALLNKYKKIANRIYELQCVLSDLELETENYISNFLN